MPINLLFLCTGNSARSLIAEGVLRQLGGTAFNAFSAGSHPTGMPNPHAIAVLRQHDIDTSFARSKSWDDFAGADAPHLDLIITVCDNAAGETCPIWPGRPATAHWGLPDPAAVDGPQQAITAAFAATYDELVRRITLLLDHHPDATNIGALAQVMTSREAS
jgi:arsenate reductase